MQINFTINIDDRFVARIKKFFTKRNTVIISSVSVLAVSALVYGAAITKTYTFSAGDYIRASEINKNFDDLFAKVNALDADSGGNGSPVGTIVAYVGVDTSTLNGWLLCYGQTIAAPEGSKYRALWTVLPAKFKSGDDIILPDLRGRVIVGMNRMGGNTSTPDVMHGITDLDEIGGIYGNVLMTLTSQELPSHYHRYQDDYYKFDKTGGSDFLTIPIGNTNTTFKVGNNEQREVIEELVSLNPKTDTVGDGEPFSIVQPSMALNYIIKYLDNN